jgi:uncharacterized protein GlcG (DUF336 family)
MRRAASGLLFVCAAPLFAVNVHAQAPAAPPSAGGTADGVPFDIPYGTDINLEGARKLIAAVEAEAMKHRWKMAITVVDTHGDLVQFSRMDGTQLGSVNVSQGKAWTAVRFRRESRAIYNAVQTGYVYMTSLDSRIVASPGGYPLVENGKIVGAIGCSGGTGDQDAAACKAGVDALK